MAERSAGPGRAQAPEPPTTPQGGRLPGLDGLRGVAALVVVVFHVLLLSPALDERAAGSAPREPSWWLTHTPLAVLWAGPQAVYVFFVLSGFVLVLPTATRAVRWGTYYPQRLVRLYVPVWGSVALALVLAAVVPRTPQPALSEWYGEHVPVQGLARTARDAVLLLGTGWLNSPLWSLRYEVLFSLLLPLYVAGAHLLRRLWAPKLVVLLVVVGAAGTLGMDRLMYLTMFALGAVLALEHEHVVDAWRRLRERAPVRVPTWAVAVVAVLLLGSDGAALLVGASSPAAAGPVVALQLLGACLAVLLAAHWAPAVHALSGSRARWLGVRSFSLYLVHEPLLVSVAALRPGAPVVVHLAVALPLSLLLAEGFYRVVERPAHLLSRRVGRLAGGRPQPRTAGPAHRRGA